MIDYYLHKKCPLMFKGQKEDQRCRACVWLDKDIKKCIFSIKYPKSVDTNEMHRRILLVSEEQQNKLSEPFRRFIL